MNKDKSRNSESQQPSTDGVKPLRQRVRFLLSRFRVPLLIASIFAITIAVFLVGPRTKALRGAQASGPASTETPVPSGPTGNATYGTGTVTNKQSPSLGFRKGEVLIYLFSQKRTIRLKPGNIAAVPPAGAVPPSAEVWVKQMGELIARIYDENEQGWVVGFELQNARFEIGSNQTSANQETNHLAAEMRGEMLTFILKSGRIQKLTAPPNISKEALNYWKDILARWQVILSDDANDSKWSRTEEDTTGIYLASYSRVAPGRPFEIRKRKNNYVSIRAAGQAAFTAANSVDGGTVINLNPYQTLIEGWERLFIPDIGISSEVSFSYRLKDSSLDSGIDHQVSLNKADLLNSIPSSLSWAGEGTANARGTQRAAGDNGNIKTEISRLKRILADGKAGTPEEVNALDRIANIVKGDDTAIDAVLDELASASSTTDMASALIGVLGAAGTPSSQLALLGIATAADWPHAQKEMALFSFVQVTDPIPEVDTWLQGLHGQQGPLANSALLVFAAMGDRVRDADPVRFNSINQYVIEASKISNLSLNDRIVLLNAIGNLGPQEVPDFVQSALKSDDAIIRQQALRSLQRIQADSAYNSLLDSIRNDPVTSVRAAAVKVLSATTWQAAPDELIRVATTDGSGQVRKEALTGLNQWIDENPKVSETFQRVSQNDRSQDVKDLAAQLLASRPH